MFFTLRACLRPIGITPSSSVPCHLALRCLSTTPTTDSSNTPHPPEPIPHSAQAPSSDYPKSIAPSRLPVSFERLKIDEKEPLIQPRYPLPPLPFSITKAQDQNDPVLSTVLGDKDMDYYLRPLYKRGWGVVRRRERNGVMQEGRQGGSMRGVALVKDFLFGYEWDLGGSDAEPAEAGEEGSAFEEGRIPVVRGRKDFREQFHASGWTTHPSVRPIEHALVSTG